MHKDHLGSTDALSNEQGQIVERMSYDAWGQRRSSDWQADDTPQPDTNRGYTGHEHIDELGIIHMNGRVYDPKIARFLSADPFIPEVNNLQSHNRYAYVMNNPLNATDPSGFFFKKIKNAFKKVVKSVSSAVSGALQNRWVRMGIAMYGAYLTGGMAYQSFMKGAINSLGFAGITSGTVAAASMTAGAVGGFTGAMIMSGGDIRAGVLGGMTGGAAGFIGASSAFGAVGTTTTGRVVAHGTVGGVSSELSGGNFKDGFVSSAFTKSVSSPLSDMTQNNPVAGSIASSVVGGTASVLSGGKFHNAALTSGFQYMFNEAMTSDIWNRKNVSGVVMRKVSEGGIYSRTRYGEWQSMDVDVSIPAVPQARGLGFLLDAYQELVVDQFRINTTIQIQNYNLYEYDAVYNLENGQRVNQMINFSSERFFKTIYEEINNTARESREYRQCIKAVTC